MLLALDVGNTNTVIGVFEGATLKVHWRLSSRRTGTSDEFGIFIKGLFDFAGLDFRGVDALILSTVVPALQMPLEEMSRHFFGVEPLVVGPGMKTGMPILYEAPREVGADRIVNAVAALAKYGGPCIVVDLGTAITFDAISANAEYLGGIICPGIGISIQGLFKKTARLPMVDFREPDQLIGTNTVSSMQSGLYYGTIAMIDGIVEQMIAKMGRETRAVATGGQASLITKGSKFVTTADEDLTLEGLRLIWELNARRA
jgi:type III pantothenate kinase